MSFIQKKGEPTEPALKKIVITLLGGSNSGKTAFFSGIQQALVSNHVMLGGSAYRLSLKPVCISRGIAKVENNALEETTEEHSGEETAAEAFQILSRGFASAGDVPAAFGAVGGDAAVPAAFAAAGGATAERKDNRQVDDLDIRGVDEADRITRAQKLYDELRSTWGVNAVRGFQAGTATTRYIELTFEVVINGDPKCLLTITDYAGELIDHSNNVPEAMLTMLSKHISKSDAAIVLASARDMSKHIEATYSADESMFEEQNTKDELSADRINSLMQYLQMKQFAVLLAVTQTDSPQVDARIKANAFQRAMHDLQTYIYSPAFCRAQDMEWSHAVLPVTAIGTKRNGMPNVDAQNNLLPDANINQENIDTAVLFCLYNAILAQEKEMIPEIQSRSKKLFKGREDKEALRTLHEQYTKLSAVRTAIRAESKLFADVFDPVYQLETVVPTGEVVVTK